RVPGAERVLHFPGRPLGSAHHARLRREQLPVGQRFPARGDHLAVFAPDRRPQLRRHRRGREAQDLPRERHQALQPGDAALNVTKLAATLVLLLAACGRTSAPASKPAASGSATPKALTVKIGYASLTGNSSPIYIAQDAGFFAKNGLNADSTLISGSPKTIQALVA